MRKYAISVLVAMLCSCGNHRERETTDSISIDIFPKGDSVEIVEKESIMHIEEIDNTASVRIMARADTAYLKNGIRYVNIFGFGPQNECTILTDKKMRPLIVYSRASEIDAQILVFSYTEGGRINIVKESYIDLGLPNSPESLLAYIHKNDVAFEYRFIYNEEESLTEIRRKTVKSDHKSSGSVSDVIRSSSGTHLEGDFRPNEEYWTSDLRGGRMDIYCKEVSNNDKSKNATLRKWINFQPVSDFYNPSAIPEEFFGMPKAISF